ncbi:GNAT family N-acetyltransferase [Micromonospora sp. WMMA1363]|uniref:GNAT family N-acetyltransferase n=1 Tax=Micromonospora sp. WMMA1363 TaxID=3053985 RepID=UPI00259CFC2B|nr:GNAT family N-acetyltransferase [Micromonospora sp. WMMA1363]MDM4719624.1 GNAT family N-acetyltransferase [Micromonospora sp. WMMA1363]
MSIPSAAASTDKIRFQDFADDPDPELLNRTYAEILEPSFPADELDGLDDLTGRVADGTAYLAVAVRGDDEPVGTIVVDVFHDCDAPLLSYLAVRPGVRGGGIGAALLASRLPVWRERAGARAIIAEVEDPRHHGTTAYGDPAARLRFYQRQGFGLAPVPFVQPRVRPDADRVTGMFLAVWPGEQRLPATTLRAFMTEYFVSAEGPDVHDDPLFNALLAALDRHGPTPKLFSPDGYAQIPSLDVAAELVRRDYPTTAAALDLLAVDERAVAVLDETWRRVLARTAGHPPARPRAAVLAELVDALDAADLWYVSPDPVDADVLAWWFAGEDEPWAGWWATDPPRWALDRTLARHLTPAVRRLPPLPRVVMVLSDVAGLRLDEAAGITGLPEEDYRAMLAAARTEVVALIDREVHEEENGGQLPAL